MGTLSFSASLRLCGCSTIPRELFPDLERWRRADRLQLFDRTLRATLVANTKEIGDISMTNRIYFRADGTAWVGEYFVGRYPDEATRVAELPPADDARWRPGKPYVQDEQVVTLCPFYPSGRLGVCIEIYRSTSPFLRSANHPPFEGAQKWMPLTCVREDATAIHPV